MNIFSLFRLNYTKMPIKTNTFRAFVEANSSMISSKQAFAVSSFLFSSKLYHVTFPDLLLINEVRRCERTSFSLLKDRSQLPVNDGNCHRQHYSQSNSKNVWRTSGRDYFKLHHLKPAFCNLDSSGIIACHPRASAGGKGKTGIFPPWKLGLRTKIFVNLNSKVKLNFD